MILRGHPLEAAIYRGSPGIPRIDMLIRLRIGPLVGLGGVARAREHGTASTSRSGALVALEHAVRTTLAPLVSVALTNRPSRLQPLPRADRKSHASDAAREMAVRDRDVAAQ